MTPTAPTSSSTTEVRAVSDTGTLGGSFDTSGPENYFDIEII
jgi:hypothetical protein